MDGAEGPESIGPMWCNREAIVTARPGMAHDGSVMPGKSYVKDATKAGVIVVPND